MVLHCFDNTPAKPGELHGHLGPTHVATVRDLEYDYQVEQWVLDLEVDEPHIVRCECPELKRTWTRGADGKFSEMPRAAAAGQ